MTTQTGRGKYEELLMRCKNQEPIPTAVAHPRDVTELEVVRSIELSSSSELAMCLRGTAVLPTTQGIY